MEMVLAVCSNSCQNLCNTALVGTNLKNPKDPPMQHRKENALGIEG